jgi:DNA-binding response OmpR family regulator
VVSNNQSFVGLVRAVLDEAGVLVRGSHDWDDVAALVEDVQPAVLALDLSGNQEMRCWALLEKLQAGAATSTKPVVVCAAADWMLDGHGEELDRDQVHIWGEPFDPADLLATVEVALIEAERPAPVLERAETAAVRRSDES